MRPPAELGLTAHAAARMQQRGIRADALETLLDFGCVAYDHHGGQVVFFDKKARTRLAKADAAAARDAEKLSRTYAVLASDGSVRTVGHRYQRIRRA